MQDTCLELPFLKICCQNTQPGKFYTIASVKHQTPHHTIDQTSDIDNNINIKSKQNLKKSYKHNILKQDLWYIYQKATWLLMGWESPDMEANNSQKPGHWKLPVEKLITQYTREKERRMQEVDLLWWMEMRSFYRGHSIVRTLELLKKIPVQEHRYEERITRAWIRN